MFESNFGSDTRRESFYVKVVLAVQGGGEGLGIGLSTDACLCVVKVWKRANPGGAGRNIRV